MSVKVLSIHFTTPDADKSGVPMVYRDIAKVLVQAVKDNVKMNLAFTILPGFRSEASIPWMLSWFLPQVDKDNDCYNYGFTIHDGLYIHEGFGLFTREECDDILRGIWREAGLSRFKAGCADKAIEWFAGGSRHWGNDSAGVGDLFNLEIL